MHPRTASHPATPTPRRDAPDQATAGRGASRRDAEPSRPGWGHRPAWHPHLPLGVVLGVLPPLAVAVAVVMAVAALGSLQQDQRDRDAVLSAHVQDALLARTVQVELERQGQEWRNALLQTSDAAARRAAAERFRSAQAAVGTSTRQLQDRVDDPAAVTTLVAFKVDYLALNKAHNDALVAVVAGQSSSSLVDGLDQDRGLSDRLTALVDRLDALVAAARAGQQATAAEQYRALALLGVLIAALLMLVVAVAVFAILRPMRRLARDVDHAANHALPAAVARVATLHPSAAAPVPMPLRGGPLGELGRLERALAVFQATAVDLAVQRRRAGEEAAQTLVNLGRRNQNLVEHARRRLDELKGARHDPAASAVLDQLGGLTSRMRRNAQSMLVLGGTTPQRMSTHPLPMSAVVRTALAEIADGSRVDHDHVEETAVVGTAVADLTHLLAELLDNATAFSPPDVRVTVVGRFTEDGRYGLRIIDHGIGMAASELAEANARVSRTAPAAPFDTHRLGLRVVGGLAARLGLDVRLQQSAGRGVAVEVDMPPTMIVDPERLEDGEDRWTPAYGAARLKDVDARRQRRAAAAPDHEKATRPIDTSPG